MIYNYKVSEIKFRQAVYQGFRVTKISYFLPLINNYLIFKQFPMSLLQKIRLVLVIFEI